MQFLEALEKWIINNPVQGVESSKPKTVTTVNRREKSRAFYAKRDDRN